MSGPVCPDCGSFDTFTKGKKDHCKLCKWEGEELPRKIMSGEMMRAHNDETRRKKMLKRKGQYFFLRVYVTGDDEGLEDIEDQIFELLEPEGINTSYEKPYYIYGETETEPTKEALATIRKMKRVKKITID